MTSLSLTFFTCKVLFIFKSELVIGSKSDTNSGDRYLGVTCVWYVVTSGLLWGSESSCIVNFLLLIFSRLILPLGVFPNCSFLVKVSVLMLVLFLLNLCNLSLIVVIAVKLKREVI